MGDGEKQETIRAWYDRTTGRARRWILLATAVSVPGGVWFFLTVPLPVMAVLQTGNGAVTIPVFAAIWTATFIFLFLVPSREGSFRSVESVERTETLVREVVEDRAPKVWDRDVKPVLDVWKKLGDRLEAKLDEEKLERLVTALESMVCAPGTGGLPDVSAGMRAFRESRRAAAERGKKEEKVP